MNWGRSGWRNKERGRKLARLCVHLGSHGYGDAAAADAPACSRGGGEAGDQVIAMVVRSGGEGNGHSHFAREVAEALTVPHLIRFPSGFGAGFWLADSTQICWAKNHQTGKVSLGSAHDCLVSGWDNGPDTENKWKKSSNSSENSFSLLNYKTKQTISLKFLNHVFYLPRAVLKMVFLQ